MNRKEINFQEPFKRCRMFKNVAYLDRLSWKNDKLGLSKV